MRDEKTLAEHRRRIQPMFRHKKLRHTIKPAKAVRQTSGVALTLILLSQLMFLGAAHPTSAQVRTTRIQPTTQSDSTTTQTAPKKVPLERATPAATATVNFEKLSEQQSSKPAVTGELQAQYVHSPIIPAEEAAPAIKSGDDDTGLMGGGDDESTFTGPPASADDTTTSTNVPSPAPSSSYIGESDIPKFGTLNITIPPDTNGAVGLNRVFTTLNNNYVIQDKTTGAVISRVSMDTFWAPTGATGLFDPKTIYEPYSDRWIVSAVSNSNTALSSILVGVSQTSDPAGTYNLARFDADATDVAWADFPTTGFNKNFIAIGVNMIRIVSPANVGAKVLVVDYPALRTGTINAGFVNSATDLVISPAATYDPNEGTLYCVKHLSSGGGTYRLDTLTGSFAANNVSYTFGTVAKVNGLGGWAQPGGQNLPQSAPVAGTSSCGATPCRIEAQDSQIRSNPVFRNGSIYYAQSIGLPATGTTHYSVQWSRINTNGDWQEGGRVDDPTATLTNGGKWYAYPSIAVNKNNDVLLGYSQFSSAQHPSAGYSFRLGTDAAGTMRDPVIYKAGEDYYNKTFGSGRNRWGDYSATQVDPSNDRDLWTLQEYAMLRVGTDDGNTGSNSSRWSTWWAKVSAPAGPGDLIISEFRLRGPNGVNDEFIELYNPNNSPLTVLTLDGSAGYSLVASDGTTRFTVPNGTTIPARGHFLGANTGGYSNDTYPAGNGTTATPDTGGTYTLDIPDNAGIALFRTSTAASFTLADRLDAVGSTTEANTLYKEGTGYPVIPGFNISQSFFRTFCPGNTSVFGTAMGCTPNDTGLPKDSNANQNDFVYADPNATPVAPGVVAQRLGAPGPENLSSPTHRNSLMPLTLLDPGVSGSVAPNRVRDVLATGPNASNGTMTIRRTVTNNTGAAVTRLRFRITDITTFNSNGAGIPLCAGAQCADLRALTSPGPTVVTITGPNPACPGNTCTVQATTLEEAAVPNNQPNGGGFNSSLSAGTVNLASQLAPGQSINVQFLLGVNTPGNFRFFLDVEVLP